MNSINSVLLEGVLFEDPLFRNTLKSGTPLCTFTIMTKRSYKNGKVLRDEVGFFNVETWGKVAETVHSKGREGHNIRVLGRLKYEQWTSADGAEKSKVVIVAEHVEWRPE